jgi:hypothetical protein
LGCFWSSDLRGSSTLSSLPLSSFTKRLLERVRPEKIWTRLMHNRLGNTKYKVVRARSPLLCKIKPRATYDIQIVY